jgi:hypothetical protein
MDQHLVSFEAVTAVERLGEHRYLWRVPDGWQQGRGCFGGIVLGALLRAMEREEPESVRRVRTLAGDLCAPVTPGPAEVRVRVLRRGSNQTNLAAELSRDGSVMATATAVLSEPRAFPGSPTSLVPEPPGEWSSIEPLAYQAGFWPTFTQHYEYRTKGPVPFGAREPAICLGWIREKAPLGRLDAPAIIGRLDAWWPTLFTVISEPRMCATIQFTAELFTDPASLDPRAPFRYRAQRMAQQDGFFLEARELWQADTLVALNQQTFAIVR